VPCCSERGNWKTYWRILFQFFVCLFRINVSAACNVRSQAMIRKARFGLPLNNCKCFPHISALTTPWNCSEIKVTGGTNEPCTKCIPMARSIIDRHNWSHLWISSSCHGWVNFPGSRPLAFWWHESAKCGCRTA